MTDHDSDDSRDERIAILSGDIDEARASERDARRVAAESADVLRLQQVENVRLQEAAVRLRAELDQAVAEHAAMSAQVAAAARLAAGAATGTLPAAPATAGVKSENTLPSGTDFQNFATALAGSIPRARDENSRQILPVLKMGTEGISVEVWATRIKSECAFRNILGDQACIQFALDHVESGISANFAVANLANWSWNDLIAYLTSIVKQKSNQDRSDSRFLPRVQRLNRYKHQDFGKFTSSTDYIAALDEIMSVPATSIELYHQACVVQALERCYPPAATKKYRQTDGSFDTVALSRTDRLSEIFHHAADWAKNHAGVDESFRKALTTGEDVKGVNVVTTEPKKKGKKVKENDKYCDRHGWCRHMTADCEAMPRAARGRQPAGGRRHYRGWRGGGGGRGTEDRAGPSHGSWGQGSAGGGGGRSWRGNGERGSSQGSGQWSAGGGGGRGWRGGYGWRSSPPGCYVCNALDHYAAFCPLRQGHQNQNSPPKNGAGQQESAPQ